MSQMVLNVFQSPVSALAEGQYLAILFWSITLGFALKAVASDTTKNVIHDISEAFTKVVGFIIQFAPIGVMGLVFTSVSQSGLGIFTQYGEAILLIVVCIALVGFVI